jgi:hypothetical protein
LSSSFSSAHSFSSPFSSSCRFRNTIRLPVTIFGDTFVFLFFEKWMARTCWLLAFSWCRQRLFQTFNSFAWYEQLINHACKKYLSFSVLSWFLRTNDHPCFFYFFVSFRSSLMTRASFWTLSSKWTYEDEASAPTDMPGTPGTVPPFDCFKLDKRFQKHYFYVYLWIMSVI